jgi:hypothetical protein
MASNKSKSKPKQFHSTDTKFGYGDWVGRGVRQPMAKVREMYAVDGNSPQRMGKRKPPKNLA